MRIINYKLYIKLFLFIIFFGVILFELIDNKYLIINILNNNIISLFYILLLQLFYLLILNLRTYSLYKKFSKKFLTINSWSIIFFKSLIFNISLNFAGTIYRALILKKFGIKYTLFLGILYLLFFSYFITTFLSITLELFFFTDISLNFKLIYFIIFFTFIFFIFYLPFILNFFLNKFVFLNSYILRIIDTNNFLFKFSKKELLNGENISNIYGLSFILHLIEISIFILSYNIFFPKFTTEIILLLFAISFLLDRIPFLSNILGSSEVIFAIFSTFLGVMFHEGLLIKFIIRLTGMLVIYVCYFFSSFRFKK
jgi:hypothetical protein